MAGKIELIDNTFLCGDRLAVDPTGLNRFFLHTRYRWHDGRRLTMPGELAHFVASGNACVLGRDRERDADRRAVFA